MPLNVKHTPALSIPYYGPGSETSSAQVEEPQALKIEELLVKAGTHSLSVLAGPVAAGTSDEIPLWATPLAVTLTRISIVPKATITGADTNYMTLAAINKGASGTGTGTIVAKSFTAGVNVPAFDALDLGTLDAANKVLAAGDVVSLKKTEAGTGMEMPAVAVVIEWKAD